MKKCHVLLALGLLIMSGTPSTVCASSDKQDVRDPVLQEVIAAFSPRMPRFIDKHGDKLFIGDEPMTRGGLMMAIYEYDKSVRAMPSRDYATKQETAELKARLASLEKYVSSMTVAGSGEYDIVQIINDLGPNMPILLDNSLNSSRVFSRLKNDVAQATRVSTAPVVSSPVPGSPGLTMDSRRELTDLNRRLSLVERTVASAQPKNEKPAGDRVSLEELTRRIDTLEKSTASGPGRDSEPAALDEIQKLQLQEKRDFARLESRLVAIEKSNTELARTVDRSADGDRRGDSARIAAGGESQQYTSLLTKVSFGLSMLAALFIAR